MPATKLPSSRLLPFVLGLVVFAVSVLIAVYMISHSRTHQQTETAALFNNYVERTRQIIEQRQQTLRETATMIESRNYLERAEFAISANSLVDFYPDILALAWAPLLTDAELPIFIERALADGVDNLHLRPLPDDPTLTVMRDNRHIISDFYFYPQQPQLHADYLRYLQHPSSIQAFQKAYREQRAIVTQPLVIEGAPPQASRFVVFYPV